MGVSVSEKHCRELLGAEVSVGLQSGPYGKIATLSQHLQT